MLCKAHSFGVLGVDAFPVEVEVDVARAFSRVVIVGLPDAAVKESLDRVRTAMQNSGYHFRVHRLTINLAPADMRKEGPAFELPMAVGVLAATEQIVPEGLDEYAVVGELALDGRVRPIRGALAVAMRCRSQGLKGLILPRANADEAAVVKGLETIAVESLVEAVGILTGEVVTEPYTVDVEALFARRSAYDVDYDEVRGQESVKRALTVAAAGAHNVLMLGPPGAGKTMLAQRLSTILPPLSLDESIETTKVYSVAGRLGAGESLMATRPFRSPHHTISDVALVGGGANPMPGEVSLAHNGVLFLDELPEFQRKTLEVLRQPMEDGEVTISRSRASVTYPSRFMLVAALNPCPCGYFTDPRKECRCTPHQIQKYLSRISGPLLDRIDIQLEVPAVEYRELRAAAPGEASAPMLDQVLRAREVQASRFRRSKVAVNSRMSSRQVKKHCVLADDAEAMLGRAIQQLGLSARAYTKVLKVARTIADLAGDAALRAEHVSEAIQYRSLDRNLWA